jgi:hypothetical protein
MHRISHLAASTATAVALIALAGPASAALTLTTAGVNAGFVLTTFVSGYNFGGNYGPLGQGVDSAGHVITGSVGDRNIYVFKDVDNQTLGDALSATHYADQTGNPNYAMTSLNGHVYGAQLQGPADYREFFDNGSSAPLPGAVNAPGGLTNDLGLWGDPTSGLLFAASNSGVAKINPLTGAFSLLLPGVFPDGITVSPDGKTLYIENGGTIQAYDALTGAFKHTFFTGHNPDGTGVIVGGVYDGQVVVNNNDGTLGLLDPTKLDGDPTQYMIIASGGTRGDFVSPDRSNGTLFIAELNDVTRLSCGPGCSIGGPPPGAPEPAAWALMIAGFGLTGAALRRRRAGAAA